MGATVIAAASEKKKLDEVCDALDVPMSNRVVYGRDDAGARGLKSAVASITQGAMADVVYDVVGGRVGNGALRTLGPGGRFLVIGFAGGDIQAIKANHVLVKGISVVGVRAGAEMARVPALVSDMVSVLHSWLEEDLITPHVGLCVSYHDIDAVRAAFATLAEGKARGKIVVSFTPSSSL